MFLFKLLSMATGEQKKTTFQEIQSHIKKLEKNFTTIEQKQKALKKQKLFVEEELYQKLDSLVDAVKKCHERASQELKESYEEKWWKLEIAKERLTERKTKAECELVVDHKPMVIPDVGEFSYTIRVDEAMRAIENIRPTMSICSIKLETQSIKLEKPDDGQCSSGYIERLNSKTLSSPASKTAEKRRIEPSTSASASGAQSDDVSIPSKKTKVETTSKRTIQTLRDFVKCTRCNKPRCVYSDRSLSRDDQVFWDVVKDSLRYHCGGSLFSPLDEVLNVEPVNCSKVVHWHCFGRKARERKFPVFCFHCGRELVASMANVGESEDLVISPVCDACRKDGIEPRIRKKYRRPTVPSESNTVISDDDD